MRLFHVFFSSQSKRSSLKWTLNYFVYSAFNLTNLIYLSVSKYDVKTIKSKRKPRYLLISVARQDKIISNESLHVNESEFQGAELENFCRIPDAGY